jgi:brefeldin A-inhibited guanine nucleotide-exchange protein
VESNAIIYSSSSNESTSFIQAAKEHLWNTINRNAISLVPQVFELSVEIFWRVLSGLRTKLKVCLPNHLFHSPLITIHVAGNWGVIQ